MTKSTSTPCNMQLGFIFSLFLGLFIPSSSALNPDGTLLLSFKYAILNDPLSLLDNWNYEDDTPCSWFGVTCASMGAPASPRVVSISLPNFQLVGSIPEELGLIDHLRTISLSNNSFSGPLPTSLFNSSELQILSLSSNAITGDLPQLVTATSLKFLNLSSNVLTGNIPQSLTSLKSLAVISLKNNQLSGSIPNGFDNVVLLDLSSNNLNGPLPLQFGGKQINYLNLSGNKLSGAIPPEFVKDIPPNATIDLSNNNFAGPIPQQSTLSNQTTDSFTLPSTQTTPPNVTTATTNSPPAAIAAIPRTINSSPPNNTPGGTSQTISRTQTVGGFHIKPKIVAIIVGDLAAICILAFIIFYIYRCKKHRKQNSSNIVISKPVPIHKNELNTISKESKSQTTWSCLTLNYKEEPSTTGSESEEMVTSTTHYQNIYQYMNHESKDRGLVMVDGETELDIDTLLKASAYVLGTSRSGIVYKAVLGDMSAFAVRRIGESGVKRKKEFEKYVRDIAKMRHPNLVRVRGFYWGDDEKLLLCDYVDNGSLANANYKRTESTPYVIPYDIRLKIAKGLAHGLVYIHEKKHVHANIKPSNILLTHDMDPVISDFGLQWLVQGKNNFRTSDSDRQRLITRDEVHDRSHASWNNEFIGSTSPYYHAPESIKNLRPSAKWDIYSFGIVLLELLTGKVFSGQELDQLMNGTVIDDNTRLLEMVDVALMGDMERNEKSILACFKLGFSCTSLVSQRRPTMKEALQVLETL